MVTRRDAVLMGLGVAAGSVCTAAEKAEKNSQRLLTRSPWAKEVNASLNSSGMGGPGMGGRGMGGPGMGGPGMGGPGMGGPGMGGPGMGGPGMGGPGLGGPPQIKVTVRWESALPVREATGRQIKDGAAYVISVSGLPALGNQRGREAGEDEGRGRKEMESRLKEWTRIERKGKELLVPETVEIEDSGQGPMFLFLFLRGAQPIRAEDKEVTFVTRMGPLEVKAKFALKDMVYQGRLEL